MKRLFAPLLLGALCLLILPLRSAPAQGGGPQNGGLAALEQRVTALQATVATQGSQIAALQTTVANQGNQIGGLQAALGQEIADRKAGDDDLRGALNQEILNRQLTDAASRDHVDAELTSLRAADLGLQNQIAPLADKLSHFYISTIDGYYSVVLTAANLHIINGSSRTETTNGLGNLVLGYNESRSALGGADDRSGSHNIVAGVFDNYSGAGGLVVGQYNTIAGRYASVSGGSFNIASGFCASVSGGYLNTASDDLASVGGGEGVNSDSLFGWSAGGFHYPNPPGGPGEFHYP